MAIINVLSSPHPPRRLLGRPEPQDLLGGAAALDPGRHAGLGADDPAAPGLAAGGGARPLPHPGRAPAHGGGAHRADPGRTARPPGRVPGHLPEGGEPVLHAAGLLPGLPGRQGRLRAQLGRPGPGVRPEGGRPSSRRCWRRRGRRCWRSCCARSPSSGSSGSCAAPRPPPSARSSWTAWISCRRASASIPRGSLACQIVGFTNIDGVGQLGIEKTFDEQLAGQPGELIAPRDAKGRLLILQENFAKIPVNGSTLQLTLDATIQHIVEDALEEGDASEPPRHRLRRGGGPLHRRDPGHGRHAPPSTRTTSCRRSS